MQTLRRASVFQSELDTVVTRVVGPCADVVIFMEVFIHCISVDVR